MRIEEKRNISDEWGTIDRQNTTKLDCAFKITEGKGKRISISKGTFT